MITYRTKLDLHPLACKPSKPRRPQLLLAVVSALSLLLAGCGTSAPGQDATESTQQLATNGTAIPVNVLAESLTTRVYGAALTPAMVEQAVRSSLLQNGGNYRVANVYDAPSANTNTHSYVVHLLERDTYRYEAVLLVLDDTGQVQSVTRNYIEPESNTWATPSCPDPTVTAVFGTNCATGGACGLVQSAVDAVVGSCTSATNAGQKCVTLLGTQATIGAYRNWLSCPQLVAFGHVGHGTPSGIALEDGSLTSAWFAASVQEGLLSNTVVFLNSCQVHNAPLQPAIVGNAGARTFIGGIPNLPMVTSEQTMQCFWGAQFTGDPDLSAAINTCAATSGIDPAMFGISGWDTVASARTTRVFWVNYDNSISLWRVDSAGNYVSNVAYGPYAGWSPINYSDGKILWKYTDGHIALWTVDGAGNYVTSTEYGPYSGWLPVSYADRKVLWKYTDNRISLWTVDATGTLERYVEHGPFTGWTPVNYADRKLLWKYTDNRVSLWRVDGDGNLETYAEHGPYSDWSPVNYSNNKLMWRHSGGTISFWTVDANANFASYLEYGPYSGWTATHYADGKLLWRYTDGRISLWTVNGDGNLQTYAEHGPYSGWIAIDAAK